MNPERLCKCGCGGSMGASDRQRQFLPKCAAKRKREMYRQYHVSHYLKIRTSTKQYRPRADKTQATITAATPVASPKGKNITAADVEAAMKWGWCPRHPDRKAAFQGLCPACAVKGRA